MYTEIKTFQDACKALSLDSETIIPDFAFFPEPDRQAMIDHAKLVIIAKAINGDWTPNWTNKNEYKYTPWFVMGSASGVGFSCGGYGVWAAHSSVGSRLCFQSSEKAIYAGTQFLDLYKSYFVKA